MSAPSPATDANIALRYDEKSLEKKIQNKTALQKELGWPAEPKRPMVCLPVGMSDELGGELLKKTLPGILSTPVEILILGKGSNDYGELFTDLARERGHRICIMQNDETSRSRMLAAADMAFFFTDPSAVSVFRLCLNYGAVPIAPATPVLTNYDPVQENGTSFLYEELTEWHCFAALVRALETYKFPFDWRTIQKQCMKGVI